MSSSPELASYNSAISRCGKSNKSWPKVLELLHLELPEVGLQANTVSYNAVSNSVRQGAWSLALESLRICQQLLRADVVTINSAIRACNRLPRWPATLQILEEAVQDGLEMDIIAYSSAGAIDQNQLSRWNATLKLLSRGHQRKMQVDVVCCSTMINSCQKGGQWRLCLHFLAEFALCAAFGPNLIMRNAAISSCERGAQWLTALRLLDIQPVGLSQKVDIITFNAAISACEKSSQWQWALQLLSAAKAERAERLRLDVITFSAAISACEKAARWEEALQLYRELFATKLQLDLIVFNATVSACEKGGQWEAALRLLQELVETHLQPNLTGHNALLSALQKGSQWQLALSIFGEMSQKRTMNLISYNSVISACVDHWSIALQLYEDLKEVKEDELPRGDIVTYSSLINACEKGHQWRWAISFFEESQEMSLLDGILYIATMTSVRRRWSLVLKLWGGLRRRKLKVDTDAGASFFLHVAVQSRKKTGDPVGFDSIGNE